MMMTTTQKAQRKNCNKSTQNAFAMGCCWLGLLLLAGIQTCSANNSLRSRNLIIGGSSAEANRFPYFVALLDADREIQCGGTLIAPDIVLTAAHCRNSNLRYADVGKYSNIDEAGFGEEIEILNPLEMMTSGNWSTVRNLEKSNAAILDATGFIHPEHDNDLRTYDVMLIKLAKPVSSNRPLVTINMDHRFPSKQPGGMNEITIIGMGLTAPVDSLLSKANALKQVHVNYLPYEDCVDIKNYNVDYKLELRPHMLCTTGSGTYGERGQCFGDSGGPYIVKGGAWNEDVQVAVVSWSVKCANPVFPMIGSRTSESIHFIKEVLCAMSSDPPAYLCVESNDSIVIDEDPQNRFIEDGVKISVRIYADPYGHELKWQIMDELEGGKVYARSPYGAIKGDHSFQDVRVPAGAKLKFKIDDAADDGVFGDADAILYEVVLVLASGELVMVEGNGEFGTSREESFKVPFISEEYMGMLRAAKINSYSAQLALVEGPTATLKIYIDFADFHEDCSWKVTSLDGLKTFAFKNANDYRFGNDVTEELELASGNYKFTISDRRGTDEFRAFNSYKLSYVDRSSLGGGEVTVYESHNFSGEEISHEFLVPASATFQAVDTVVSTETVSTETEILINNRDFLEEAQTELCTRLQNSKWCTSHDQCCSNNCQGFRCKSQDERPIESSYDRNRMRAPVGGGAGGSSRNGV